jgi:hypothetical protein
MSNLIEVARGVRRQTRVMAAARRGRVRDPAPRLIRPPKWSERIVPRRVA